MHFYGENGYFPCASVILSSCALRVKYYYMDLDRNDAQSIALILGPTLTIVRTLYPTTKAFKRCYGCYKVATLFALLDESTFVILL